MKWRHRNLVLLGIGVVSLLLVVCSETYNSAVENGVSQELAKQSCVCERALE